MARKKRKAKAAANAPAKPEERETLTSSEAARARWAGRTAQTPFGDRVRKKREAMGWSQTELGEALGVTRERVSAIENAEHEPTMRTVRAIAQALACEPGALITP